MLLGQEFSDCLLRLVGLDRHPVVKGLRREGKPPTARLAECGRTALFPQRRDPREIQPDILVAVDVPEDLDASRGDFLRKHPGHALTSGHLDHPGKLTYWYAVKPTSRNTPQIAALAALVARRPSVVERIV